MHFGPVQPQLRPRIRPETLDLDAGQRARSDNVAPLYKEALGHGIDGLLQKRCCTAKNHF